MMSWEPTNNLLDPPLQNMFPAMLSRMRCPLLLMACACCVACVHDVLVIVMKQKQLTIALSTCMEGMQRLKRWCFVLTTTMCKLGLGHGQTGGLWSHPSSPSATYMNHHGHIYACPALALNHLWIAVIYNRRTVT